STFHIYDPAYQKDLFSSNMGNTGLGSKSLVLNNETNIGFNYGINCFNAYLFNKNDLQFYKGNSIRTNILFINGAKKEQILDLKHFQSLSKTLTGSFRYRIINSIGQYSRQASDNRNFNFTLNYTPIKNKYAALFYLIHNRIKLQESGGVPDSARLLSKTGNEVKLSRAENILRETSAGITQRLLLSADKKDSSNILTYNPGYITYNIIHTRTYFVFNDLSPDSTYYPDLFFSDNLTKDSLSLESFKNSLLWHSSIKRNSENLLNIMFNLSYNYYELSNKYLSHKTEITQIIPQINIYTNKAKKLSSGLEASFVTSAYKDYLLAASLNYKISNKISHFLTFKIASKEAEPDEITLHYISNSYFWNNNFKNIKSIFSDLTYTYKSIQAGIRHTNYNNYIYFDNKALPAQYNNQINCLSLYIYGDKNIGNFYNKARLVYQKLNKEDIIRQPEFLAWYRFYFNFKLFKQSLTLQPGIDLSYYSAFKPYSYSPSTRQFYLQDDFKTKDYLNVAFSINFQFSRASFFVKYQTLNELFTNDIYYTVKGYPIQSAAIKFGINWYFLD
ncbi:MAG: hypothetical protein KA792_08950, partial [Bacteroidales bacterium]|nr:hypothetical protein [Bacteroidales bacterium]